MTGSKTVNKGLKGRFLAGVTILGAAIAGGAAITGQLTTIWQGVAALLPKDPPSVSIAPVQYVHFRPRAKPPADPSAIGVDTSWSNSPLAIIAPLSYLDHSKSDTRGVVTTSEVSLTWENGPVVYQAAYIVKLLDEKPCGEDWLCKISVYKPENLINGQTTDLKETLFLSISSEPLRWDHFIDRITSRSGPSSLTMLITADIELPDAPSIRIEYQCHIDVGVYRQQFEKSFISGQDPRPTFWQPNCGRAQNTQ